MSGADIAYVSLAQTAAHLAMLLAAFLGFTALALGSERYAPQLIGRVAPPGWRLGARVGGWVLLAIALTISIAYLGVDTGITIWLGWLSVSGLALVFGMSAWSRRPVRKERVTTRVNAPSEALRPALVLRGIGVAGLIATVAVFAYSLMRVAP